ncbi:aromatic ring-hydroxylating oxygenase subunit alpha [Tumebacillus flagellatus]|uniref:2Fe-2S ferredoxin n=1 Tax=Tumebacillus flagellatus TaxID=1157490 RepID=A0A074LNJ1_9BACL|nr:aromatic ring-hydroxylating dioxygenase subunit alpha [Tumebacillus flagellatus]KEO83706.1 2Fe-2S ferredoxin [Tumebacillus flagellatus]
MSHKPESFPSDETVFPLQWYAVAWSRDLQNKPMKRKLAGRDFVLFRDDNGQVRCVQAYCPHRGADLSLGACQGGALQCPYHGWEFAGDGQCLSIPSQPNRPIPEFAHNAAFPVMEQAQLIWVYPERLHAGQTLPNLQLFPELSDPNFVLTPFGTTWQAHVTRAVESVLDVAHLAFVHKKTIGRSLAAEIANLEFTAEGDSIKIRNGGGLLEYLYPQHWILKPSSPGKNQFIQYVTFTPVDREETALFGLAGRTFAKRIPGMNLLFGRYSNKVLQEDQAIVESQHPRPIPEALRMEAHVAADAPQVRFRQRWFEFLTGDEARVHVKESQR